MMPVFEPELSSQVYSIEDIRRLVEPIAIRYGVDAVYLFGSYARGEARADSDIDLHVDKGQSRSAMALAGLYCDLQDTLRKKLDVLTTSMMSQAFYNQIHPEEVLLYARTT